MINTKEETTTTCSGYYRCCHETNIPTIEIQVCNNSGVSKDASLFSDKKQQSGITVEYRSLDIGSINFYNSYPTVSDFKEFIKTGSPRIITAIRISKFMPADEYIKRSKEKRKKYWESQKIPVIIKGGEIDLATDIITGEDKKLHFLLQPDIDILITVKPKEFLTITLYPIQL